MSENETDEQAAARVAAWLRDKATGASTWYEVRALMQEFEIDRFTSDAHNRMTSALSGAGVDIEPDLRTRERRDAVILSLTSNRDAGDARSGRLSDAVTVRVAETTGEVRAVELDEVASRAAVRWFDLHQPQAIDLDDALATLTPLCPGLTAEMLVDLCSPDPRPKTVSYDAGRIRSLSTFRVSAIESDDGADDDSRSKAGVLVFDPVEILVGPDWLITSWHQSQKFRAARRIKELPAISAADIYAAVERSWSATYSTSGDLAVLLLLELAMTYKPACRQLRVWAEEWELDYFRTDHAYEDTLVETQANLAVLRDWLSPLNISGMRHDINRAWFPGVSGTAETGGHERALRVDDRVDQSLAELHEVGNLVRAAYELLEVRRLKNAQDRDARFQRTIAIGGSAILIPTLVAGVMGANTWVPGEYGPTSAKWAFVVLIVVMAISAAVAWFALKRMHDGD